MILFYPLDKSFRFPLFSFSLLGYYKYKLSRVIIKTASFICWLAHIFRNEFLNSVANINLNSIHPDLRTSSHSALHWIQWKVVSCGEHSYARLFSLPETQGKNFLYLPPKKQKQKQAKNVSPPLCLPSSIVSLKNYFWWKLY